VHEVAVALLMGVLLSRTLAPRRRKQVPPLDASVVAVELGGTSQSTTILLAIVVDGVAQVRSFEVAGKSVTVGTLATTVVGFLAGLGVTTPVKRKVARVVLVAGSGKATLARIADATRDARIRQLGADVHHADLQAVVVGGVRWQVALLDFAAFFGKAGTEEVARSIGVAPVEDIARDAEARMGHDLAVRFAVEFRGVAVVALAFRQFRDRVLGRWGVDPLRNTTLPSIAGRIFLTRFLRSGPAPWKKARIVRKRRTAGGYRDEYRDERVFAGNQGVRVAAARALWGGMTVAFIRGFCIRPLVEWDAVSLYPHSAIVQPLPFQRTRWRELRTLDEVNDVEGFVRLRFEFRMGFPYPNFPTARDGVERLNFVRTGVSNCTVSELRVALRLGAQVQVEESHVFVAGERERNHDLSVFMREMLADKAAARRGSLEYETPKLLMNALIGKLAERYAGTSVLDFERAARRQGQVAGLTAAFADSPVLNQALKRGVEAGSVFAPEWAALTIGRGRAIMGDLVATGETLHVSTDSVITSRNTDISCPSLVELRSAGSDLRLEHEADAAFINRTRSYALLKRPTNVTPQDPVLAANDDWVVIRVARHGSDESKAQFADTVLRCIAAEDDVAPERVIVRRVGASEAVKKGLCVNDAVPELHRSTFDWDGKRRILNRDPNVFREFTSTQPYETVGAMEGAERQSKRARRRSSTKASREHARKVQAALSLLWQNMPAEEVAGQTGLPLETVGKLAEQMPADEGGGTP
jgi:hypothetical protein